MDSYSRSDREHLASPVSLSDSLFHGIQLPIRIHIVSDVRLYRDGLSLMVQSNERLCLVGTSGVSDALAWSGSMPDVILLDIEAPGAYDWARRVTITACAHRVVAFGVNEIEQDIVACAEAGIVAYVPRDASMDDLTTTLARAMRGEATCPPHVTSSLFRRIASLSCPEPPAPSRLTPRETEILALLSKRFSNKEIARFLHIETATVKNHVHHILDKLNVRSRHEAVARTR